MICRSVYMPAEFFYNAIGNGKTKSHAFSDFFGSEKRFKYLVFKFTRDTGSCITYLTNNFFSFQF